MFEVFLFGLVVSERDGYYFKTIIWLGAVEWISYQANTEKLYCSLTLKDQILKLIKKPEPRGIVQETILKVAEEEASVLK